MSDGSEMVTTEMPKEKVRLSLLDALTFFLLLSGAVGGGMSVTRVLAHFGVDSGVCNLIAGIYWILYCALVISRIRTKSDVQRTRSAAYNEGFLAGRDHESPISYAAGEKRGYDRGYQNGLLDGRADGWDYGYESALKDHQGGRHDL